MNILHLISSPRGQVSASIKLGNAIVEKLETAQPGSTVKVHDLTIQPFPVLEEVHIQSFFTPTESLSPELAEAVKHSDDAIADLEWADAIVIGAPMYNFSVPASLKSWIDHIARAGKTFSYSAAGVEGLIKNKKVYLAISAGGVYSEGPFKAMDFAEPYMRSMLSFLGMTDITTIRVDGLNIPGIKEHILENTIASIAI